MFRSIVHANDGTENALSAFKAAIDLALLTKANLEVIFVEECEPRSGTIEEIREQKDHADREVGRGMQSYEGSPTGAGSRSRRTSSSAILSTPYSPSRANGSATCS